MKYFVKNILQKKANYRICNFKKLKNDEFFNDYDWDGLVDFRLKAPYVPETSDPHAKMKNLMSPYESVIDVL